MTDPDIAYGDLTFQDSHPGQLAAVATLLGLTPPPVDTARILELGCGTGFNILSISQALPQSHCTGIDYSPVQIQRAQSAAASVGATNIEFRCQSIQDFPAPPASFDYIIAHGVYSWISAETRDALMALIERCLAPNGVAYISYNTYPGWRSRIVARDILTFFAQPGATPAERARQSREGAAQLIPAITNPDSLYGQTLQAEVAPLLNAPDYYIAHEYLVENNFPTYFQDFAAHAGRFNLQYLAESRLFANSFVLGGDLRKAIDENGGTDILRREQYLDFLIGCYFRQSLLCHASAPVSRDIEADRILPLSVSLTAEILDVQPEAWRIRTHIGAEFTVDDKPIVQILALLRQHGPAPVPAHAFVQPVIEALGMQSIAALGGTIIAGILLSGWSRGIWILRADTPALVNSISPQPQACPLARLQAESTTRCTNRLHRTVNLTPAEQALLKELDGTREMEPSPALARLAAEGFLIA